MTCGLECSATTQLCCAPDNQVAQAAADCCDQPAELNMNGQCCGGAGAPGQCAMGAGFDCCSGACEGNVCAAAACGPGASCAADAQYCMTCGLECSPTTQLCCTGDGIIAQSASNCCDQPAQLDTNGQCCGGAGAPGQCATGAGFECCSGACEGNVCAASACGPGASCATDAQYCMSCGLECSATTQLCCEPDNSTAQAASDCCDQPAQLNMNGQCCGGAGAPGQCATGAGFDCCSGACEGNVCAASACGPGASCATDAQYCQNCGLECSMTTQLCCAGDGLPAQGAADCCDQPAELNMNGQCCGAGGAPGQCAQGAGFACCSGVCEGNVCAAAACGPGASCATDAQFCMTCGLTCSMTSQVCCAQDGLTAQGAADCCDQPAELNVNGQCCGGPGAAGQCAVGAAFDCCSGTCNGSVCN